MSKESLHSGQNIITHLPTESALSKALKGSELTRGIIDWMLVAVCILGLYILMKSQLDHAIESSTLPHKKSEKELLTAETPMKMEAFSSQRKSESEIWTDLKDLLERKKPARGNCHIHTREPKTKNANANARGKPFPPTGENIGIELACWLYSGKKVPALHTGAEQLLTLQLIGMGTSDISTLIQNAVPNSPPKIQAQDMSSIEQQIKPEGWIETPSGILRFDAKEERWK